jgi:hypothetical protein
MSLLEDEERGKDLIRRKAVEMAEERGMTLKRCAWGQDDKYFDNDQWVLILKTREAREIVPLVADDEIADYATDRAGVRDDVDRKLGDAAAASARRCAMYCSSRSVEIAIARVPGAK